MKSLSYIGSVLRCRRLIEYIRFSFLLKVFVLISITLTLPAYKGSAQAIFVDEKNNHPFGYDETLMLFIVDGYINFYSYVLYTNNDLLYVNVEDLFNTLKIPCKSDQKGDKLSGFIEDENRTYLIDHTTKQIKVGSKIFDFKNGLIKETGAIFMESSLFAETFGIKLTFNYRSLSIRVTSDFELPVIKLLRLEKMRANISKLKGEDPADTIVKRDYHLFKFGMLDWSGISSQTLNESTNYRFRLGVGTELLYGEADLFVNFDDRQKFDNRQLHYLWRWVDNDKKGIKQAQVGNIYIQTTAFINSQIIGATVRNTPTTIRKATGFYTINEFTEPNWNVELYINNVLVGFTKADASGLFNFKVPIVYGYTTLKLKFYGPLGEERTEERTMNVPYTIMAPKEFEYGLSAGVVLDSTSSRFGKAELNYGVNRLLTVGGGLEYLSSIPNSPFIPFVKATFQPFNKLTLNSEYSHGVRIRGLLDYYFWKDALLEIDYAKYVDGQRATFFNANEERKIRLSIPFRIKKLTGLTNINYQQLIYKDFFYNQSNIMVSIYYKQLGVNSSTQFNWIDMKSPYVTSDLGLSYRLNKGYTLRSSAQYNVSGNTFMACKAMIEKSIPRGLLSATYERNFSYNGNYFGFSFTYDLPFARTSIYASHNNGKVSFSESAQGSIAFGAENTIHSNNSSSVAKGGIMLYPFLDLNNNGIFDADEQLLKLNSVKIYGARAFFSEKDSIVRIPDLNAFVSYNVGFNDYDLENIAWRFKHKTYQILIDPNQFKRVDIPVVVVGEVTGMAYFNHEEGMKGIGRILIKFYKKNGDLAVAETLSESDGYISFMGLEPGEYIARIDSVQLSNLGFTSDPPQHNFSIKTLKDGDSAGGIDFVLQPEAKQP
ncbi:MAG: hypothetical protein Q8J88_00175 [Bacteroidales bacterium]|nr:hypothetical protein [Bacteroidales bacterium]